MTPKERVELAIQTLGAPVMDYSPTHANLERRIIIEKTTAILMTLLRELWEVERRAGYNGD